MLLQRLVAHSRVLDSETPAFYKNAPVRWQLNLTADGELANPELLDLADPTDKARKNGVLRDVPYVTKTSADAPAIGTDTGEYLLGWFSSDGDDEQTAKARARAGRRTTLSRALHARWAQAIKDPMPKAVTIFLHSEAAQAVVQPAGWAPNHLIQIAVSGVPVADLAAARAFWASEAARRKSGHGGVGLVWGQAGPLSKTLPQQLNMRLVPLATMNSALVCANKPIHTYDHTDNLTSTIPICLECGRRAVSADDLGEDGAGTRRHFN